MTRLRAGKLPIGVLKKTFLNMTGLRSPSVTTPARAGLDFAAIKVGKKYMIVSAPEPFRLTIWLSTVGSVCSTPASATSTSLARAPSPSRKPRM